MHRFVVFGTAAAFALVGTSCKSSSSKSDSAASTDVGMPPRTRHMEITYEAKIAEVPAGTKELKLWVPKPRQEGAIQQVLSAAIAAPPGATVVDGRDAAGETTFWCVTVPNPVAPVVCTATMNVARSLYDTVLSRMRYSKDGTGWVPVDISEADKFPELAQYYFGSLTEDRVSFSAGRDLKLDPSPASGVQNFFIYPIAEADGKSVKADKAFKYRDL